MFFSYKRFLILLIMFNVINSLFAQSDNNLDGTWVIVINSINIEMKFENGIFEESSNGILSTKGTYTINNRVIILDSTHKHGDILNIHFEIYGLTQNFESRWYDLAEIHIILRTVIIQLGYSEIEANNLLSSTPMPFSNFTFYYFEDLDSLYCDRIRREDEIFRSIDRYRFNRKY